MILQLHPYYDNSGSFHDSFHDQFVSLELSHMSEFHIE